MWKSGCRYLVIGKRMSGKTTTAKEIAETVGGQYHILDDIRPNILLEQTKPGETLIVTCRSFTDLPVALQAPDSFDYLVFQRDVGDLQDFRRFTCRDITEIRTQLENSKPHAVLKIEVS